MGRAAVPLECPHRVCRELEVPKKFNSRQTLSIHRKNHSMQIHQLCFQKYGPDRCDTCRKYSHALDAAHQPCPVPHGNAKALSGPATLVDCTHSCVNGNRCMWKGSRAAFYQHVKNRNLHPFHDEVHDCQARSLLVKVRRTCRSLFIIPHSL